jgi:enoyl-CoA hydratase/carnithine racemase
LSQILGITKAKEIVMLGEPIGAHEALKLGLINKVETPEKFMEVAENMAETLSKRSAKAFEELKNLCSIVPRMDKMAALDIESSICTLLFARDERKEEMKEVLPDKSRKK